jgi:hypothetical protein
MFSFLIVVVVALAVAAPVLLLKSIAKGIEQDKKLLRDGKPAKATILEVRSTGTRVNHEPLCELVVEVEPAGEPPFQNTFRQLIPVTSLAEYKRGAVVTVKYDPTDRKKMLLAGVGFVEVTMTREEANALAEASQRLLEELNRPGAGVPASALVRAFVPTGVVVNGNNPLAKLEIKVLPTAGTPFDATIVGVFGEASLHKYQPGKEIAVVFDPANPTRVTMDLSRTPSRQS